MANRAILMLAAMAAAVVSVAGVALAKDFTGTDRSDFIKGTAGADLIRVLDGDDLVFSKDGKDDLRGNPGDDILGGQGGRDTYHGGSGQRPHLRHPAGDAGPPKGALPGRGRDARPGGQRPLGRRPGQRHAVRWSERHRL